MDMRFAGVTESNLNQVLSMTVLPEQRKYVPSAEGILARAWSHRENNAVVHVIMNDTQAVGLMLYYELTEEPACYCLMEMMIDAQYQNRGFGKAALRLLIEELSKAPRYPMIELSCDRENVGAIHVYESVGFADSGYVDPDLPQYVNMVYRF